MLAADPWSCYLCEKKWLQPLIEQFNKPALASDQPHSEDDAGAAAAARAIHGSSPCIRCAHTRIMVGKRLS